MYLLNLVLLWLHFMALAVGGIGTFGIPLLGARMMTAEPAARPALGAAMVGFSKFSGAAIGILILTGLALLFGKYGGVAAMNGWFWLKMLAVAGLIGVIAINRRVGARAMAGDAAAARLAPRLSLAAVALLLFVVACAVLAFE